MLRTCVKHNLKTMLRDPATLLAVLALVVMRFALGISPFVNMDPVEYYGEYAFIFALSAFYNLVGNPVWFGAFAFIGVIVAVDLFRDKRANSFDILTAGQIKFSTYYLGKLIAYYVMALMLCVILTLVREVLYIIIYIPPHPNFSWGRIFLFQFVEMLVLYTGCLFVPIAYAVFLSALTGIPAVGTIFNCVYYYIPFMIEGYIESFLYFYVHVVPFHLGSYLKNWILSESERRLTGPPLFGTTLEKALLAHGIQLILSAAMFVSSYFLLKARFKKE